MIEGRVTGVESGAVVGWIAVAAGHETWLEALAEGEGCIGRSRATPSADGRAPFAIPIPESFRDGRIRFLDVRAMGEHRPLPGGPVIHHGGLFDRPASPPVPEDDPAIDVAHLLVEGQAVFVAPNILQGWAWAPEEPSRRLTLEIIAEGRFIAAITADQPREDLAADGVGDARYGFRVDLSRLLRRGPHRVGIRVAGALDALPGSEVVAGPFAADGEVDCPGYLDDDASRTLAASLPFEHLAFNARGIAPARLAPRLLNRLRRERMSLLGRPLAPAVLLRLPGAGERAAGVWALQSHPHARVAGPADGAEAIRQAVQDAGFVFFGQEGDLLHPSAAAIAAGFQGCEVMAWGRFCADEARPGSAGTVIRRPPFDPATARHGGVTDTTLAVKGAVLAAAPDDVLEALAAGRLHPLWFWLAGRGLAWRVHPEALTTSVGDPPVLGREIVEADEAVYRRILGEEGGRFALERSLPDLPFPYVLVPTRRAAVTSVLVPFRNRAGMTLRCINALSHQRLSGELQLVLVDNQSRPEEAAAVAEGARRMLGEARVVLLPCDGPFNHSAQNNLAARAASGEVILICNNDVVLDDPDAVEQLSAWALEPGVGTVGCRLEDPDRGVGSYGQVFAPPSGDPFRQPLMENPDPTWAGFIHACPGNTLALAAMARDRFLDLGGPDEERFPIGYNDIDFALRCGKAGLTSLYLGHVRALHPRGSSRTGDNEDLQALRLSQDHPTALAWLSQLSRERIETARHEVMGDLPRSAQAVGEAETALSETLGAAVQARRALEQERTRLAEAFMRAAGQAEKLGDELRTLRSLGS